MNTLKLRFGAMSPTIKQQLKEQGYKMDATDCVHFQKDAEAITRLRIRGMLNDSQCKSAHDKLFKNITKSLTNKK
jgi:hypothetical protein